MMTDADFIREVQSCERTLYRVSRTILSSDADCCDAVQEALTRAWKHRNDVNPSFFKTWLVRILINVCNKQLKSAAKTTELHDTDIMSDSAEASTEIRMAIESLPVKIRQVVALYYIEQFTVKEIKQILKIPEGTVKSRLSKGRELLKDYLTE